MRIGHLEVTGGFFLLLAWLNYLDRQLIVPMAAVACMLHELGHYLVIRLVGGNVRLIRLTAIGAEMVVARPLNYWQEGIAALAGPAVNLVLALVFCSWTWGAGFAGLNLVLALFNLIPVGRLDGGRALHCLLALLAGPGCAQRAGEKLDLIFASLALGAGVWLAGSGKNFTLFLVAMWLLGGVAKQNNWNYRKKTCQRIRKPVQ